MPGGTFRAGGAGERRLRLALAGLGIVLVAACLFYAFVLPQTPSRLDRASARLIDDLPLWSWVASPALSLESRDAVAAVLIAGAAAAFGAYAAAIALTWRRQVRRSTLVAAAAASLVLFLPAALALPTVNSDIFDYIAFGRVRAVHGANPYEVPPSAFPDDPIYPYASPDYTMRPDNKLPVWTLLNTGMAKAAGGDPVRSLLAYRFVLLALSGLNVLLIALLLARIRPEFALAGTISYGWNPIVAVYGVSKTDTVMVLFLLLAALALVRERHGVTAVALALSACVKLITLSLTVVYVARELVQRRWRELAIGIALFAGVVFAVYAPFGGIGLLEEHLGLGSRGTGLVAETRGNSSAVGWLLRVAVLLAVAAAGVTRDRAAGTLFRRWAAASLVVTLAFSQVALSWYLMTLIAATALAATWWLTVPAVVLAAGAFLRNSWRATSTSDFPLPDLAPGPGRFVYFVLLGAVGVGIALVLAWRSRARRAQ